MRLLLHGATLGGTPELTDLIEAAGGGFAGVEAPWSSVWAACRRGVGGFARRLARLGLCVVAADLTTAPAIGSGPGAAGSAPMSSSNGDIGAGNLGVEGSVLRGLAAFGVGAPLLLLRVAARQPPTGDFVAQLARMGEASAACGLRLTLDVVDDDGAAAPAAVAEALAAAVPHTGIGLVADSQAGPLPDRLVAFARLRRVADDPDDRAVAWASALYQGGYRGYVSVVAPPPRGRVEDGLAAAARGLRFAQGVLRRAGI